VPLRLLWIICRDILTILALQLQVTDPQNLGALLRSALFFGADGVVACAKNSASLTPTVSKASSGALEVQHTDIKHSFTSSHSIRFHAN
jgi:tRNA G18 (ribose-2'-O)-methylase SpoU